MEIPPQIESDLWELALAYAGGAAVSVEFLKGDGSDRKIRRFFLAARGNSFVGVAHKNKKENADFLYLTEHFRIAGTPVPEVLKTHPSGTSYLLEDLGDSNLADRLAEWESSAPEKIVPAYKAVLDWLPRIQTKRIEDLSDFFQGRVMDGDTFRADLRYFVDSFLETTGNGDSLTPALEAEFEILIARLERVPSDCFVHRDFQSRNFMWVDDGPRFIDYQSAFLGPRYYDLASMLYASKAFLTDPMRAELVRHYYENAEIEFEWDRFESEFYDTVLVRRIRSLGTYGHLSLKKGKQSFFDAIEPALEQMLRLLSEVPSLREFPEIRAALKNVANTWVNDIRHYQNAI